MAASRKGIQQGSLNFRSLILQQQSSTWELCDWLFYSTDPVTHFCCCDLSRIRRHYGACHLVVLPLEKEESKEEQLSSTQSFMGLCPGAKRWTRRLLHSRELSISHPWEAPKRPRGTIMMCKDRKALGNPGDPPDSVFWPKPELM